MFLFEVRSSKFEVRGSGFWAVLVDYGFWKKWNFGVRKIQFRIFPSLDNINKTRMLLKNSIVLLTNIIIIFIIFYLVSTINSDKSIIIFVVFYPILALLNLILYFVFSRQYKVFIYIFWIELLLLLPFSIKLSST